MQRRAIRDALGSLSSVLADRELRARLVIVGGAALLLREGLERPTMDVDVVAVSTGQGDVRMLHRLPEELVDAATDVAAILGLDDDWLNAGAVSVVGHMLPEGFHERLRWESFGSGLEVAVPARIDLLRLKLLAAADEGPGSVHVSDLVAVSPSEAELGLAEEWAATRRSPEELRDVTAAVRRALR